MVRFLRHGDSREVWSLEGFLTAKVISRSSKVIGIGVIRLANIRLISYWSNSSAVTMPLILYRFRDIVSYKSQNAKRSLTLNTPLSGVFHFMCTIVLTTINVRVKFKVSSFTHSKDDGTIIFEKRGDVKMGLLLCLTSALANDFGRFFSLSRYAPASYPIPLPKIACFGAQNV